MTNKKDLPLILLEAYNKLMEGCIILQVPFSDFININFGEFYVRFSDNDPQSNFHFTLSNPQLTNDNKTAILVKHHPQTEILNVEYQRILEMKDVAAAVHYWASTVKKYNQNHSQPQEAVIKQYEEEWFSEFKSMDEDAQVKTFDPHQQLYFHRLLPAIKEAVKFKESDFLPAEADDINNDLDKLQKDVTALTKEQTMKKFSRVMAKIRKGNIELFSAIWETVKREGLKRLVNGTMDGTINYITHIKHP
jgi:hypothetical protein